jgi:ribonuclease P protein component
MTTEREKFTKTEKLCSRKTIEFLFENGSVFYNPLFKVVWVLNKEHTPYPAQVAFSVSKRGFRLAVVRNLVKRRMREAYRKNKHALYDHLAAENIHIAFIVIQRGNTVHDFIDIEKALKAVIDKLIALTSRKT